LLIVILDNPTSDNANIPPPAWVLQVDQQVELFLQAEGMSLFFEETNQRKSHPAAGNSLKIFVIR